MTGRWATAGDGVAEGCEGATGLAGSASWAKAGVAMQNPAAHDTTSALVKRSRVPEPTLRDRPPVHPPDVKLLIRLGFDATRGC